MYRMNSSMQLCYLAVGVLLVNGCSSDSQDEKAAKLQALQENRAKWESRNESDYVVYSNYAAFAPMSGQHASRVIGGQLVEVYSLWENQYRDISGQLNNHWYRRSTVPGLFSIVSEAIGEADVLEVSYHPEFGYPTRINIDYYIDAVDDELTIAVENVQLSSQIACTEEARAGLIIHLDFPDDAGEICNGSVTIEDGDFSEAFNTQNCDDISYSAAYERRGTYRISVQADAYQSQLFDNVQVFADLCHVVPVELTSELVFE